MRLADDNSSLDNPFTADTGQWGNNIELLKWIQDDYRGARRQLEQVSRHLAEREALVSQHLQQASVSSGVFQPLCLVEYKVGNSVNQLGRTILGGTSRPLDIPVSGRINIRCFGRFEVHSTSGQLARWHSIKAKSVLQFLLIHPREPTVKDTIMEALWPECSPQAAANNLKVAVHQLRLTLSGLGGGPVNLRHILFMQGSYLVNPEMDITIDVEEFEKHWDAGRRCEKQRNIVEAMREYECAEALYLGNYLEEELYEEWTILRREGLKDIYLIILGKLANQGLIAGDYESCIHYSQKMLARDNCREEAYRWLMYCYARLGQRNRALRWYDICCQVARTEMETAPDRRTTELYSRILKDEEI